MSYNDRIFESIALVQLIDWNKLQEYEQQKPMPGGGLNHLSGFHS